MDLPGLGQPNCGSTLSRYNVAISIAILEDYFSIILFLFLIFYNYLFSSIFFIINGSTVLPAKQDITGGVLGGVILHVTALAGSCYCDGLGELALWFKDKGEKRKETKEETNKTTFAITATATSSLSNYSRINTIQCPAKHALLFLSCPLPCPPLSFSSLSSLSLSLTLSPFLIFISHSHHFLSTPLLSFLHLPGSVLAVFWCPSYTLLPPLSAAGQGIRNGNSDPPALYAPPPTLSCLDNRAISTSLTVSAILSPPGRVGRCQSRSPKFTSSCYFPLSLPPPRDQRQRQSRPFNLFCSFNRFNST